MPKIDKNRVRTFLRIYAESLRQEPLLVNHILQCAKVQKRKKLTHQFMLQSIASFFSTNVYEITKLIPSQRPRRSGIDYSRAPVTFHPRRHNLLALLARREARCSKYGITENADWLNGPVVNRLKKHLSENIKLRSQDQLILQQGSDNTLVAKGPNNTPYKAVMKGSSGTLWREEVEPPHRVTFDTSTLPSRELLLSKYPDLLHKPDSFEFTVTKDIIAQRLTEKRPCSQKQVTGYSAKEFFAELGIVIQEKTHGSFYHLAHRHGFGLGGQQTQENLDPATEGSNYQTLFFIENPIAGVLLNKHSDIQSVHVKGEVSYHPDLPIPQEITYTIRWGNGRMVQKTIYPLDYEKPTITDNQMAKAYQRSTFTIKTF